jgi:hypothetical protein
MLNWFKKNKENNPAGLKKGDWVNSYSKGIFRIENIIQEYYDESERSILNGNSIGDPHETKTIILKKLLTSSFKKSLDYESCNETFVSKLSPDQQQQLDLALKEKPELIQALDGYTIPALKSVYNMPLRIDTTEDLEKVNSLISFIGAGRTFSDIEAEMHRLDIYRLKPENFGNYMFQLVNFDFEYREKKKIWRDAQLTASK